MDTWGLELASPVSVNRHAMLYIDHHAFPKEGFLKPRVKNLKHYLFPSIHF